MKIALAQIKSYKGQIERNIQNHIRAISSCPDSVDMIVFPELSFSNYEMDLSDIPSISLNDKRFNVFQRLSNEKRTSIAMGAPITNPDGTFISLVIFQPLQERTVYHKQLLDPDEKKVFTNGDHQTYIDYEQYRIAFAICYEALQPEHFSNVLENDATLYMASVAKHQKGVEKANSYFKELSEKYRLPILMANCIGPCDTFLSAGQSAVWDNGAKIGQLDNSNEGILLFDTNSKSIEKIRL